MERSMLQQTDYKYGFSDDVKPKVEFDKGLTPMAIREISNLKDEPRWMLDYRLDAYKVLFEDISPRKAILALMGRGLVDEHSV